MNYKATDKICFKGCRGKSIKRKTDTSCVHPSLHALFNVPSTANIHQTEILQEKKKKLKLYLEDKEPHKSDDICPEAECSPS